MKWALRLALGLYPPHWRRRYGRELEALVEDSRPGWVGVFDILRGAFVMQIRDVRTIPLLAALIGACLGTVVYLRAPALYASSSTIRFTDDSFTDQTSGSHRALGDRLSRVLRTTDARGATSVTLVQTGGESSVVRISHFAPEARHAQDVVKELVAAALDGSRDTVPHGTVIEPPAIATKPQRVNEVTPIPVGAGVGLILGGAFVIVRRGKLGRSTTS